MDTIYSLAKLVGSWQVLVEQLRHSNTEGQTMLLATATKGFDNAVLALNQAIDSYIQHKVNLRINEQLNFMGFTKEEIAARMRKG